MNKKSSKSSIQHLVPNNPQYDRTTKDPKEVAAERLAIKNTLYDSSYKTAAGHWKHRDEPGEPRRTEYLKISPDVLRKQKQWDARQRLKRKDAVPTKKGKKLFDEFMKEANSYRSQARPEQFGNITRDLGKLRNLYNAASVLEFDKWIIFVGDTLNV